MKLEIKSWVNGSVLFSLETENMKLCLEAAVKSGANLSRADLSGANLSRADLSGADLSGADLSGANLSRAYLAVHLGYPNGWTAFAWLKDGEIRVQVGCRDYTLAQGRAYWKDKPNRCEILAALDYAEQLAKLRGWKVGVKEKVAA